MTDRTRRLSHGQHIDSPTTIGSLSTLWVWGWILQGCSSNTNFCTALCDGKWWHNYNCSTPLCLTTKLMHNTVVKKKWNIFRWLNVLKWSWRQSGIIHLRAQRKYEAKYYFFHQEVWRNGFGVNITKTGLITPKTDRTKFLQDRTEKPVFLQPEERIGKT